jgi:hypothetical protein
MQLPIQSLPLPPLTRQIYLVSRNQELSNIPEALNARVKEVLADAVSQHLEPLFDDAIEFL